MGRLRLLSQRHQWVSQSCGSFQLPVLHEVTLGRIIGHPGLAVPADVRRKNAVLQFRAELIELGLLPNGHQLLVSEIAERHLLL